MAETVVVSQGEDERVPPTAMVAVEEGTRLAEELEEREGVVELISVGVMERVAVVSDEADMVLVAESVGDAVGEFVGQLLPNPEPVPAALLRDTVEEALPLALLAVALVLADAVGVDVGDAV